MAGVWLCLDESLLVGERVLVITEVEADFYQLCQQLGIFALPV